MVNQSTKYTVLVLRGGPGRERQISLSSGSAVAAALLEAGHVVIEGDISPDDLSVLDQEFDVVFSVLHGTFGEDGQLQEILEARSIPFVGSGSRASRTAMNKHQTKQTCAAAGINTAPDLLITESDIATDVAFETCLNDIAARLGFPCVVKPNQQGSSVGVSIVNDPNALPDVIGKCVAEFGETLIEKFIAGGEYTVGIIGRQPLPVLQIKPATGFYDFKAKYEAGDTSYIFELDVPEGILKQMQSDALTAFNTLHCKDISRIDFMLTPEWQHFLLEVNTLPGFTDHSLVPMAAGRIGHTMPSLCDEIVQMVMNPPI